jgi:Glycosyltransferase family 10 (fucosyltransferase) C-term/Fucosyltransferase, N-terminal
MDLITDFTRSVRSRFRRPALSCLIGSLERTCAMLVLFYDTMWGFPLDMSLATEGVGFIGDRQRFEEADAVVFHLPEWTADRMGPPTPSGLSFSFNKRPGQVWVAWSMECDEHYSYVLNPHFMSHFDLTMTYHPDADIPATYVRSVRGLGSRMIEVFRQPAPEKQAQALVASFISSDFDLSGRQAYLRELANGIAVDSYGKFMRNRTLVPDHGPSSKSQTISRYKFTIAFENARGKDYVTEKFYDPFWAGSVPIYLGAPNVEDFAPGDHCFINTDEFSDPRDLADYLLALSKDDDAYDAYFDWKKKPFRQSFEALVAKEELHPLTRLCEALKARKAKTPAAAQG